MAILLRAARQRAAFSFSYEGLDAAAELDEIYP